MDRARVRIVVYLALSLLLVLFAMPAIALAGEPVPGAEIFLQQQPGDDPKVPTSGRTIEFGPYGGMSFPAGAVAASIDVTFTLVEYPTPMQAQDGTFVKRAVKCEASNPEFLIPVTLSLTIPASIRQDTANIYWWNPDVGVWQAAGSPGSGSASVTRNGDKVVSSIDHFSWYGVGGTLNTTSTPASSNWSLAVGAIAALGIVAGISRRRRRAA